MEHTLDLCKMGLEPITQKEMLSVEGGKFWDWVLGVGIAVIVVGLGIGSLGLAFAGAGAAGLAAYEKTK